MYISWFCTQRMFIFVTDRCLIKLARNQLRIHSRLLDQIYSRPIYKCVTFGLDLHYARDIIRLQTFHSLSIIKKPIWLISHNWYWNSHIVNHILNQIKFILDCDLIGLTPCHWIFRFIINTQIAWAAHWNYTIVNIVRTQVTIKKWFIKYVT